MKLLFYLLMLVGTFSCVSHQELVNFKPLDPVTLSPQEITNAVDLEIQPEDLLRITVSSLDPEASIPFNMPEDDNQRNQVGGGGAGGSLLFELTSGYFVDADGYIDFPVLGPLLVAGLTLTQVKQKIVTLLAADYLKNPVVNIRFLNLKITVLGEVLSPGIVRLSNKRVTILEAIGIAGDLTPYANRSNILVLRENEGVRTFERLDIQSENIFESPYYYLQQNDVIYVEPITARVATVADPAQRIIQYASALLSFVSLVVAFSR